MVSPVASIADACDEVRASVGVPVDIGDVADGVGGAEVEPGRKRCTRAGRSMSTDRHAVMSATFRMAKQ